MDPLEEEAVHPAMPQGTIGHGAQTSEEVRLATDRPQTNDRRKTHMRLRNWSHANPEPLSGGNDAQAGHSRDAKSMAAAFEPLNKSLETILTRLSRTNERSEKCRRVFKKPRCYKNESDGCIDTWIEVMKLHFEEEDLSERQECSALSINLEGTALKCVMAKKQYQRDTAEKSSKSC